MTPVEMASQLRRLGTVAEFVSLRDVRDAALGRRRLPPRALLVTFDDGLREQFDYALPVLDALGIPAGFFVNSAPTASGQVLPVHKIHISQSRVSPSDFAALVEGILVSLDLPCNAAGSDGTASAVYRYDQPDIARLKYLLNFALRHEERQQVVARCFAEVVDESEATVSQSLYMGVEQIRALGALGYLGTHGHEHVPLAALPPGAAREDMRQSVEMLEEWAGCRPYAIAYPYGTEESCSVEVGAMACALGLDLGFTAEPAGNPDLTRRFQLARFDCNDLPGGRHPLCTVEQLFEIPVAGRHR